MITFFISILLWIWDNRSSDSILKGNRAKVEAEIAFQNKNYKDAINRYEEVVNASFFVEPEARLNLAHSYWMANDEKNAINLYKRLSKIKNQNIASESNTQLGVIFVSKKDTAAALAFFKKALVQNEYNQIARYDYELLKAKFSGIQTEVAKQPKTQTIEITQSQKVELEVQKSEEKNQLLQRLKNIKMTEKQALALLDVVNNEEVEYLLRRKLKVKKTDEKGKW